MRFSQTDNSFIQQERGEDMTEFDVIFVTYNSEKWIDGCIRSLAASDYDLKRVGLYFVDNDSSDKTVAGLERACEVYGDRFRCFEISVQKENLGFGKGNNLGSTFGNAPYLLFLNIDTEVYTDTLSELARAIEENTENVFAMWELRQFPYEHPKYYDPLTGKVTWSSGAAFVIKRELYKKIGGFDPSFFMYGEDVDLSWRVRKEGFEIRYVPKSTIRHYCYQKAGEVKPTQFIYSLVNHLLLRNKFGSFKERVIGYMLFYAMLLRSSQAKKMRKAVWKAYRGMKPAYRLARKWRRKNWDAIKKLNIRFYGLDYELRRYGAFFECDRPIGDKKISIIIRTCGRPDMLREALISVRNQTYKNIEVVVAEDGPEVSKTMIEKEFSDLNIIYKASIEKRGRCHSGNEGMRMATGEYFNFLDDDDVLLADHVETLVMALQRQPEYKVAYAIGAETAIKVLSKSPYRYSVKSIATKVKFDFDVQRLLQYNCFPIQAVMFHRDLFAECGGMDETLPYLEDWDMWIRYALHKPFLYVEKTTSMYRVPADEQQRRRRQEELDKLLSTIRDRYAAYVKEDETPPDTSPKGRFLELMKDKRQTILFRSVQRLYHFYRRITGKIALYMSATP